MNTRPGLPLPVLAWALLALLDRAALRACSIDPQWWTVYDRLPIAPESVNAGRGDPIGVGAA